MADKHIPKPPKTHPWKKRKSIVMSNKDFDKFLSAEPRQPSDKIIRAAADLDENGITLNVPVVVK